jgi:uncharacterized OsmC-like protein
VTTTIITNNGGLRFDAEVRGHIVPTDQPVHAGGSDSAAMPLDLLNVALGTCIALYTHQFLASRQLPTQGLRVEVVAERAAGSPKRIGRFDVRIALPDGVPSSMLPLIERVAKSCPVHNTLEHPPAIDFEILSGELVG